MILGFTQQFPWKEPTRFIEKIISHKKIHSIREGQRWRKGMAIHMATGTRSKQYEQFNKEHPELQTCTGTQTIIISPGGLVLVDGNGLNLYTTKLLAENDGFDSYEDFRRWFKNGLHGQIVHWTDYRY